MCVFIPVYPAGRYPSHTHWQYKGTGAVVQGPGSEIGEMKLDQWPPLLLRLAAVDTVVMKMVNGEPPHSASAFGGHQESQEQPDAGLSRLTAAPISRGAE